MLKQGVWYRFFWHDNRTMEQAVTRVSGGASGRSTRDSGTDNAKSRPAQRETRRTPEENQTLGPAA
jgi:hypothetical protein